MGGIRPYLNIEESIKPVGIENTHHIVPKHEGGSNIPANKARLYENIHEALHRLFGTMPPHEQIQRILDISNTALTDNFKADITRLTEKDKQRVYRKGIRLTS